MKKSRKRQPRKTFPTPNQRRPIQKNNPPATVGQALSLARLLIDDSRWTQISRILAPFMEKVETAAAFERSSFYRLYSISLLNEKKVEKLEETLVLLRNLAPESLDLAYLECGLATLMREHDLAIQPGQKYVERLDNATHAHANEFTREPSYGARLLVWLGNAYRAGGRDQEARETFCLAINKIPDNQTAYVALALMQKSTGDVAAANETISNGFDACHDATELKMIQKSIEPRPTISACMIVRNEESMITACLESVRDWVDEIILVDTGSSDRTTEIAAEYGAKIFNQKWQDDFSFHRNYSIAQASSEWILVIDADERIPQEDVDSIREAIGNSQNSLVSITIENTVIGGERITSVTSSVRLFRRSLNLKYSGIVHNELILPPRECVTAVSARIRHLGYNLDINRMTEKFQRTKRLLEKQMASEPNNPFARFNFAQQLCNEDSNYGTNNSVAIIDNANRTIDLCREDPSRRHLWMMSLYQLSRAYFSLEDYKRARSYCQQAVAMKPNYLDVIIQAGFCSVKLGEYVEAANWFRSYLKYHLEFNPILDTESLIIWHYDSRVLVLNNLGLIAEMSGGYKEAQEYYRQVLELDLDHVNARERINAIKSGQVASPLIAASGISSTSERLSVARQAFVNGQVGYVSEILNGIDSGGLDREQSLEYYRLFSLVLFAESKFSETEQMIASARSCGFNSLDFDFIDCLIKLKLRDYGEVEKSANSYIDKKQNGGADPDDIAITDAHLSKIQDAIGVAKMNRNDLNAAAIAFEEAIRLDPSNQSPYLGYIRLARSRGDHDRAQQLLNDGIKQCSEVQELRLLSEWSKHKVSIAVCMIVKDEEAMLPDCLDSIRDWVNELVIVDTGSSDKTVEIAESYGARVFHQTWEGDFSKHRNYSIEQATADWVFIIDADERFEQEDLSKLLQIVNDPSQQAISINVFNYYEETEHKVTSVNSLRFFRRELNLRYEGIVHNQINIPEGLIITRAPISIRHLGYDLDPVAMAHKFERTRSLLEKQLEKNPDFAFGWFNLAQLYRGHIFENPEEYGKKIITASQKAVELTSADVSTERYVHLMALDQLAWTYFYLEKYQEAEKQARQALTHKHNYLDPLMLLGHIYAQTRRFPEAITAYQNYLEIQANYDSGREIESLILIHPDSRATAQFGIGSAAELLGNLKLAKESYLKAHEATPGYLQVPLCLGRIYLNEGDLPRAEKYLKMQLAKKEPSVHALLGLAHLYSVQAKTDKAEICLIEALEEDARNPNVLSQMADFYLRTYRPQDALRLLESLNSIVTNDVELNRRLGDVYFSLGVYTRASEIYRLLLEDQPENSALLNDFANCCFKMERYQEAEQLYRQALQTESADVIAFRNLGLSLVKQSKPQDAVEILEKYIELMPEDHQIRVLLGELHSQIGRYDHALGHFETYLKENPTDSDAMARIADCYLLMGHEDSALVGYRQALAIDPDCQHARQRIDQLQTVS